MKVKTFAKQIKRERNVEEEKKYKILGLRLEGRGLFLREDKFGFEIKATKLFQIKSGDFTYSRLFGWKGSFDIVTDEFNDCYVSNEFPCFLIDNQNVNKKYLLYFFLFQETLDKIEKLCTGTTKASRNRFKEDKFLNIEINLPSITKQNNIVERIDQTKQNYGLLNSISQINSNYISSLRQSILQEAVQGKLTADWRKENPDVEPASELLKRIKAEKEKLIKEGKIKKQKLLPPITEEEIPFELPEGWEWCRLNNLYNFIDYRGKTPHKMPDGVKLITAKNVKKGFIRNTPEEFVTEETYHNHMTRGFPKFGDLLFTTEAPLAHVAKIDIKYKFALAQRVINFQGYLEFDNSFILYSLMSIDIQELIILKATGMTAKGIKAANLKLIPIPIPPLLEQKEIVTKVDKLMQLCDELEDKIKQAEEYSEQLMESVLREAFEES